MVCLDGRDSHVTNLEIAEVEINWVSIAWNHCVKHSERFSIQRSQIVELS